MYRVADRWVRRQHVQVEVRTSGDPATVYALLRDGASWPLWSPIESFELEWAGADEPEGIGAIRIFRRGRVTGRDQVAELVPDRRFGYRHLSGLPVRDYRATIDLDPDDGGTRIRWQVSFLPRLPAPAGCCAGESGSSSTAVPGAWQRTQPPRDSSMRDAPGARAKMTSARQAPEPQCLLRSVKGGSDVQS